LAYKVFSSTGLNAKIFMRLSEENKQLQHASKKALYFQTPVSLILGSDNLNEYMLLEKILLA